MKTPVKPYGYNPTVAEHEAMCEAFFPAMGLALLGMTPTAFDKAPECACFEWKCSRHDRSGRDS